LPNRIRSSSLIIASEVVQFTSYTFPSLIGGIVTILGIRRRLRHVGVLSLQLKFVSGIGICGVVSGFANLFIFLFYRSHKTAFDVGFFLGATCACTAIALTVGAGLVLAIVVHDPVRYYKHFNRGKNPFPRTSAVAVFLLVLTVVIAVATFLGAPWDPLLYVLSLTWAAFFFGTPAYCIWKLVKGEWCFDPDTKAKLLQHLITVCAVSSTSLIVSLLLYYEHALSSIFYGGPAGTALQATLNIFNTPSFWTACIWTRYLFCPPKVVLQKGIGEVSTTIDS
jgi:hypothetical protein